jgi:Dyp-type peroxidase family
MTLRRATNVEFHDIQGLVQRGYKELPVAEYGLFQIEEPVRARAWLARIVDHIEPATGPGEDHPRDHAVQVAFTCDGLRELGLAETIINEFPREFREGMVTTHRGRLLGDMGQSEPAHWDWGAQQDATQGAGGWRSDSRLHLLVLLYAKDSAAYDRAHAMFRPTQGLREIKRLGTSLLAGPELNPEGERNWPKEHFGFRDGIAQPHLAGFPPRAVGPPPTQNNTIPAGEGLLGYENAYGEMPEGPTDAQGYGFGRNGTFLVFRQLRQDVVAFWNYIGTQVQRNPDAAITLASKMVGRWPDGTPLVLSPDGPKEGAQTHDQFTYANDPAHPDPYGFRCPIGSHIRRTNPRDSLNEDPEQAQALANRHRMIRRSRAYGQPLVEDMDPRKLMGATDNGAERGLHFISLNAAISRQFEFVQNLWVNSPKFGNLYDDPDPLIGVVDGQHGNFTVQAEPVRRCHAAMPRFVQVRGGAYFFLPGIQAVRTLATLS